MFRWFKRSNEDISKCEICKNNKSEILKGICECCQKNGWIRTAMDFGLTIYTNTITSETKHVGQLVHMRSGD